MWIDSHCHLGEIALQDSAAYFAFLSRAKRQGVGRFLSVALSKEEYLFLKERKAKGDPLDIAIGIHPFAELCRWQPGEIENYAGEKEVSAIGEIGLDYSRETDKDRQRFLFRYQMDIALRHHKPIVVHSRQAEAEMIALLREKRPRALMHAYPGSYESYCRLADLDIYFSFGTILTQPAAHKRRKVAAAVDITKLLIESDAPYGRSAAHPELTNEPAFLKETALCLASLRGIDSADLEEVLTANYVRFCGE